MDKIALSGAGWSLTIPEPMYGRLQRHLFPGDSDEHGAVMIAGMHRRPDGNVRLLARELHLATDGVDYVPGKRGYRMLKAQFIQRHILACRDEKLVYLAIHNHGGDDSVGFSRDDLESHERGYPALLDINRGNPVGALVFSTRAVAGDIWLPSGQRVHLSQAQIIGRRRTVIRPHPAHKGLRVGTEYDRQTRMFGDSGQLILRDAKVAIIGLGGVGSIVAEFLARLGVGSFVLIDPDRLDPSNLPRVVGAQLCDIWWGLGSGSAPAWLRDLAKRFSKLKVNIARRVIRQANSRASVQVIAMDVLDPQATAALLNCDYIFLAADQMRARLLFNCIVHQYFIPGVQIGSKVSTDAAADITDIFSTVRPVTPGENCLWCNQLINPTKLADEAKTGTERRGQRYVDDPDIIAPSVITLNGVGAAHACNDFLMYMTGLTSERAEHGYFRHDSRTRAVSFATPRCDPNCAECSSMNGSRLGQGDCGPRLPFFAA